MIQDSPLLMAVCAWGICAGVMTVAWFAAVRIRFLSLVDALWAIGIGLCGAGYALVSHSNPVRAALAAGMALFWGLRLGYHLATRLWAHYPQEDSRYVELKRGWSSGFLWKSFLFFQFQAFLQAFFSFPFATIVSDPDPLLQLSEIAGLVIFVVSVMGEAIADAQLKRFKADPSHRGQVCNVGLWRYSRHPNYFFEWMIWCGVAVMAVGAPMGWLALACPFAMLFLLLFVTGVAPSEAQSLKSRGEAYRKYQLTTSKFIPWFPKGEQNVG